MAAGPAISPEGEGRYFRAWPDAGSAASSKNMSDALEQFEIEVPDELRKSKTAVQQVFVSWLLDPGKSLKQHCRDHGVNNGHIYKLSREQDWNRLIREHWARVAPEVMNRRAQEAALAMIADFGIIQEMWRVVCVLREQIFDEDGNTREIILEEQQWMNSEGVTVRSKKKVANIATLLREYQKALREFVELRRVVTGLEMMDKVKVSEAGQSNIVNNVEFQFGEGFVPATG